MESGRGSGVWLYSKQYVWMWGERRETESARDRDEREILYNYNYKRSVQISEQTK